MKLTLTRICAAALLAGGAIGAHANTVNLTDFTFTPAQPLTVSSPSYSGSSGQFKGTLDGNSFTTYCTELTQTFSFNTSYSDYSIVDGNTAWGAAKALMIGQLLTAETLYPNYVNSAARSAVIQAGIWEILYESSGSYGFGTGTFTATSSDPTTNTALGDINWAAFAYAPNMYKVDQLYSPDHQNFLVTTAVPEPDTYALMAAGLAGIGFMARRRSRRD